MSAIKPIIFSASMILFILSSYWLYYEVEKVRLCLTSSLTEFYCCSNLKCPDGKNPYEEGKKAFDDCIKGNCKQTLFSKFGL